MPPHSNSHVPQESQSGKYKYTKKQKNKKLSFASRATTLVKINFQWIFRTDYL